MFISTGNKKPHCCQMNIYNALQLLSIVCCGVYSGWHTTKYLLRRVLVYKELTRTVDKHVGEITAKHGINYGEKDVLYILNKLAGYNLDKMICSYLIFVPKITVPVTETRRDAMTFPWSDLERSDLERNDLERNDRV